MARVRVFMILKVVGGLLLLSGVIVVAEMRNMELTLRASLADEQVRVFYHMRSEAASTPNLTRAAQCLDYANHYYRSGTKQKRGTPLDRLVERVRSEVVQDIIGILRQKSGEDLGDDPEAWIKEYGKREQFVPTTPSKGK